MTEAFNACLYLLDRQVAAGLGGNLALTGPGGDLTYDNLLIRVRSTARSLTDWGLQPEQRILMFMSNGPEFVIIFLAALRIGAIPVPVSTTLRGDDLAALLVDSCARLLAVTKEFSDQAAEAINAIEAATSDLVGIVLGRGARWRSESPLTTHLLTDSSFLDADTDASYTTVPDSPAFWLYTSGTTGRLKAAMHRHASVEAITESIGKHVMGLTPRDCVVSVPKAFFAFGLNAIIHPLAAGATIVLDPAPPTPVSVAATVDEYAATVLFVGPGFLAKTLEARLDPLLFRGLRIAFSAGEPLPAELYRQWKNYSGVETLDMIGMTETLSGYLSNRIGMIKPGTAGIPVPGYEVRVVDDAGYEVPDCSPGTLIVKGESLATGYWRQYEESKRVFGGAWLRSGDTFMRDNDGFYTFLGRNNDMLKPNGIWVSPREIEGALTSHHEVSNAVVVGAPGPYGMEKAVAFVQRTADASVTDTELIRYCRELLPAVKRPHRVFFPNRYPVTPSGKIRRDALRDLAAKLLAEDNIELPRHGI